MLFRSVTDVCVCLCVSVCVCVCLCVSVCVFRVWKGCKLFYSNVCEYVCVQVCVCVCVCPDRGGVKKSMEAAVSQRAVKPINCFSFSPSIP